MFPSRIRVFHLQYGMSKRLDINQFDPETFGVYFDDPNVALGSLVGQTVLYSTSLTDKNGVEIFQGDIVSVLWNDTEAYRETVAVRFEGGGYYPFAIPGNDWVMPCDIFEVLCNIYQNPELLPQAA